jgi:hypothetical protein
VRPITRPPHLAPSTKQLAQVAVATLLLAGCPVAIVWWLRASGTVSSAALGLILGMALSLGASCVGRIAWEKSSGSEDLLFSELMVWGYLHRCRSQRRLASAYDLLGPMSEAQRSFVGGLSTSEQAKLLERLVAGMETRDPYLHGHSRRVARHSWMIARRMGLPRAQVARIRTAAAVHDVGKIETPKTILHKAGPLTVAEYDVIKTHPDDGARMTAVLRDADLTSMVRHHHERLDGTGYPSGLSADAIPLGARIIAVADTFDAITSVRPYRPASPHKKAIDILKNEAGTKLDPDVVRAFCSHYAGRGPLAVWSAVAGLPERVISWLGGSLASVASVAKAVAVATLVGGAAAGTAAFAPAVAKPRPTTARTGSGDRPQAQAAHPTSVRATSPTTPAPTPGSRQRGRQHGRPSLRGGPTTSGQTISSTAGVAATPTSQPLKTGGVPGQGTGPGKIERPGKGKEPPVKTEPPGKSKEPPVKSTPPGKSKEPPVKTEPPGKSKEPPTKAEPPGKGKEPPVKAEPPVKTEPPGKTEPPAKGKGAAKL